MAEPEATVRGTPTLLKLKEIKGTDGLNIIQKIAVHDYKSFGMYLLQDENGERIDLIEKNNINKGVEAVTQAIFQKWLTSDASTCTYQHLEVCLRKSELGTLAKLIAIGEDLPTCRNTTAPLASCSMHLDSELLSYASYLKGVYMSMSQSHTSQHWTHLPRCEFIKLAVIDSGHELRRGDREENVIRLTQQGKIETLHQNKLIDLTNLFLVPPSSPNSRVILIEGAPGVGKSTLALHICHQWAQNASYLARFDIVVIAYLRDQVIQNATSLAELLSARTLEMSKKFASRIKDSDGKNVLFVFDGWDEFPLELQYDSIVATIIQQPHLLSLHRSTILITSRPVSSANLLHIADRQIEILGFTKYQIHEYIRKALYGKNTQIERLVQHLEDQPAVEGHCYIPLHAAILVHLFLTLKGALPTTLHELFCNLVLCCIVRELETYHSKKLLSRVSSLDNLPDDLKSKLKNLCALAYEFVKQEKVLFDQADLAKFHLPTDLPSLGLLQAVEGLTLVGKSLSYNFLHLSVQELLAAYHISHLDPSEQIKEFKLMLTNPCFHAVLHFYSGFTKLANPAIQDYISTYSQQSQISEITELLPLLHCFYEAQDPALSNLVSYRFRNILLYSLQLNPMDYLAIGYFIASLLSVSSSDPPTLKIEKINENGLKFLLLGLSKYPIGELPPSAGALANEFLLNLYDTVITDKHLLVMESHLKQSSVIGNLILPYCKFECDDVLLHLAEALKTNSHLAKLQMFINELQYKEHDCFALKEMLQMNKSLTHLILSKASDFNLGACYIFQGLQHNNTLVHLNLSDIGLVATENTAQALTTMLRVNKTLTHLDLSVNSDFSNSGAYCVCQGLKYNATLVNLDLMWTGITDKGAEYIAQALESNRSLQTLDISLNDIANHGFSHIMYALQTNTTLRTLSVKLGYDIISVLQTFEELNESIILNSDLVTSVLRTFEDRIE